MLLVDGEVLCHPFVMGELACGTLKRRAEILDLLRHLPQAPLVSHEEALTFVAAHALSGTGVGWIDVHVLSSTLLVGAQLWTLDRPLARAARTIGVFYK